MFYVLSKIDETLYNRQILQSDNKQKKLYAGTHNICASEQDWKFGRKSVKTKFVSRSESQMYGRQP